MTETQNIPKSPLTKTLGRLRNALLFQRLDTLDAQEKLGELGQMQAKRRKGLWGKIMALLSQITFLKAKEKDLLSQIEGVEKKHRFMRLKKKLRRYAPDPYAVEAPELRKKDPKRDKDLETFWIFAFANLFFNPWRRKKNDDGPGVR